MKWFIASLCIFASPAFASFAPPNDLKVPEFSDPHVNTVTRRNFEKAIALVFNAYGPEIWRSGSILQINNLWTDSTVNAEAYPEIRDGVRYLMINAYGGLARYGRMSTNGYVGVLCHELGHHVGGRPRSGWASVEGQADYWGFGACMLRVMSLAAAEAAAQSLGDTLADLDGERRPRRSTPDLTKVSRTMIDHPPAQCRYDTFLAALRAMVRPRCWYKP